LKSQVIYQTFFNLFSVFLWFHLKTSGFSRNSRGSNQEMAGRKSCPEQEKTGEQGLCYATIGKKQGDQIIPLTELKKIQSEKVLQSQHYLQIGMKKKIDGKLPVTRADQEQML
jgi:hypothetical protein